MAIYTKEHITFVIYIYIYILLIYFIYEKKNARDTNYFIIFFLQITDT